MNCQPLEAGLEAVQLGLEHAESHDWQGEKCISDYVNYVHCFVRQRCYKNNRTEKGKPAERQGRKATGLRDFPTTAEPPVTWTRLGVQGASRDDLFPACHE